MMLHDGGPRALKGSIDSERVCHAAATAAAAAAAATNAATAAAATSAAAAAVASATAANAAHGFDAAPANGKAISRAVGEVENEAAARVESIVAIDLWSSQFEVYQPALMERPAGQRVLGSEDEEASKGCSSQEICGCIE